MMSDQYGTPGHDYIDMGQAATGAYNAAWLSWLKADAAAAPAPVTVVRIWQEINGNWMPWSINQTGTTSIDGTLAGSPWPAATIIRAFQNMAEQVRIAFPIARIEWNLNAGGRWSRPNGPGDGTGFDLYPGDAYVDVIGLDAYEKHLGWAKTVSGPGVNLNNLVAFATTHNKLVGISETAAHKGDGKYLTSMTNYFDRLGTRAAYISYYDQGSANNGDNIIYSTTGPDSAPALRDALNASSFGAKPYGGNL
jgi:beta-mannanase